MGGSFAVRRFAQHKIQLTAREHLFLQATRKDSSDDAGIGTDRKHDQQMESKNEIKCDDSES